MFFAALDSKVRKSTSHQRALAVARPVFTAMSPARMSGTTLATAALKSSLNSNFSVLVAASTSTTLCLGRYSIMPL